VLWIWPDPKKLKRGFFQEEKGNNILLFIFFFLKALLDPAGSESTTLLRHME